MRFINNNEDKCFEANEFILGIRTLFIALNIRLHSHEEMATVLNTVHRGFR